LLRNKPSKIQLFNDEGTKQTSLQGGKKRKHRSFEHMFMMIQEEKKET
jgi:hypothetical protein